MMHILVHDYAGHPFQVQLSRELARRGHEVTHAYASNLLTPRGSLHRRENDPGHFRIVEIEMSDRYRSDKYKFLKRRGHELTYGDRLADQVHCLRPDLVISSNTPTEPQWKLIKETRALRVPFVSWVQDFYSLAVTRLARKKMPLVGLLAGSYYRWLDAKCFRESAAIVIITEEFSPALKSMGIPSDRISTIPNWAPLDELPLRPKRNKWATEHGLDGKFVFLYSGTLAMKHNPDFLKTLAMSFRNDPDVRIVLVSEGPGAEYLMQEGAAQSLANLLVLPFQDFSLMPEVLASADVLIALLEGEADVFSVPSKVLTYHAAGKPILGVIPAANLAARIIASQGSGVSVKPDDIAEFMMWARTLHRESSLREIMANKARIYAETSFNIEPIANEFEAVFKRAVAHAP